MPSDVRCIPTPQLGADPPYIEATCSFSGDDSWQVIVPKRRASQTSLENRFLRPQTPDEVMVRLREILHSGRPHGYELHINEGTISFGMYDGLIHVSPNNRFYRELAVYAAHQDPSNVFALGANLLEDPSFLVDAWIVDTWIGAHTRDASPPLIEDWSSFLSSLNRLNPEVREGFLRATAQRLGQTVPFPSTPSETRALARLIGTPSQERVRSLRTVFEIAHNNGVLDAAGNLGPVDRPIAAVMVARDDWNGALTNFPLLDTLVESGAFHLFYSEVGDEREILARLEQIRRETGQEIHTWVLGGHGTSHSLALDPDNPERGMINFRDLLMGGFSRLHSLLAADGQVLLWSCSNGAGGAEAFNLANFMARAVPGREVISVQAPSNILSLQVESDLRLSVDWSGEAQGYVAIASE